MTIVLQCLSTGKFMGQDGWTLDRVKARSFLSLDEAERFCHQCSQCKAGSLAVIRVSGIDYTVPIHPAKE